jgi:hypothetical protein
MIVSVLIRLTGLLTQPTTLVKSTISVINAARLGQVMVIVIRGNS